jgi:hypothetical protein
MGGRAGELLRRHELDVANGRRHQATLSARRCSSLRCRRQRLLQTRASGRPREGTADDAWPRWQRVLGAVLGTPLRVVALEVVAILGPPFPRRCRRALSAPT